MGISLTPGAADASLQQLARRAEAGDKRAQLELGIRFAEGQGIVADRKKAKRLYILAATASGGVVRTYLPPIKEGGRGQIVSVDTGAPVPGLQEARRRLADLRTKD